MPLRPLSLLLAAALVLTSASSSLAAGSWLKRVLRIAGLSASPSQMKSAEEGPGAGDIWIAEVAQGGAHALTHDGGYGWPVFVPKSADVVAVRAGQLVRLDAGGGVTRLGGPKNVVKLVGFDTEDADSLLLLVTPSAGGSPIALWSLRRGTLTPLPYQAPSDEERHMLEHMRGQERTYRQGRVYLKTEAKAGMAGTIEWTDVYFKRSDAAPRNVSHCDGVACSQPSLSADGARIAFVKSSDRP
jgi:hypothetical protein